MDLLSRLRYWRRWTADIHVDSMVDVPEKLPQRQAVVVGRQHEKWLVFDCPCRQGHQVMLNLDPENRPRWRVRTYQPLTLLPSVNERSPAGHCHYVVREGRVHWIERTDHL